MFPTDYDTLVAADNTYDDILSYNATDMLDERMADVILSLQQFCTGYQSSDNSTILIDFANTISALQAAGPYCSNKINSPTPRSSLGFSSTTSTSILSTLTSTALTRDTTTKLGTAKTSVTFWTSSKSSTSITSWKYLKI